MFSEVIHRPALPCLFFTKKLPKNVTSIPQKKPKYYKLYKFLHHYMLCAILRLYHKILCSLRIKSFISIIIAWTYRDTTLSPCIGGKNKH